MPIRSDLRKFYTAACGWPATRRRILERAGGRFGERGRYLGGAKCEQCGAPDRLVVHRGGAGVWFDTVAMAFRTPTRALCAYRGAVRAVHIVLTVAHLNHTPGDDRDENLKALCQWCHLNYDKLHHKETRCLRKDRQRPLLVPA